MGSEMCIRDRFKSIPEQDRTVLEFDVSDIPDDAQINFAEFSIRMSSFISDSSNIDIIGYSGDGAVTTTDAEVPGQFLATFQPIDFEILTFAIDTDVVADNLASDFVGFRLQSAGGDTLNSSVRQNSGILSIVYSLPSEIVEVAPTQVTRQPLEITIQEIRIRSRRMIPTTTAFSVASKRWLRELNLSFRQ